MRVYISMFYRIIKKKTGIKLLELNCTDLDDVVNGDTVLSIVGGDASSPKFSITGQGLYVDANNVDYEALNASEFRYVLTIYCVDQPQRGNTYTASTVVTVQVCVLFVYVCMLLLCYYY